VLSSLVLDSPHIFVSRDFETPTRTLRLVLPKISLCWLCSRLCLDTKSSLIPSTCNWISEMHSPLTVLILVSPSCTHFIEIYIFLCSLILRSVRRVGEDLGGSRKALQGSTGFQRRPQPCLPLQGLAKSDHHFKAPVGGGKRLGRACRAFVTLQATWKAL
jgi:hypothetical protein